MAIVFLTRFNASLSGTAEIRFEFRRAGRTEILSTGLLPELIAQVPIMVLDE